MNYRQGSHSKFKIEYHFVWSTKYRYQVLRGDIALRVKELVRQTCERFEIHNLRGVVSKDHFHASFPFRVGKITISGKNCFDYCLENYQKTSFDFNIENDNIRASDETESSNPGEELDKG